MQVAPDDAQAPTTTPETSGRAVSRARLSLTVVVTVVVVLGEFLLLAWVYHGAAPLREQGMALSQVNGVLQNATGADGAATSRSALGLLEQAVGAGVPAGAAAPAVAAATEVATNPDALPTLRVAVDALEQQVADAQRTTDVRAYAIFATLIFCASVGWMVWFRRLVARHRSLEHEVTAQTLRAEGEHRLAALVRESSDVVAVIGRDAGVSFATPSTAAVLGVEPEDLLGTSFRDLVVEEDRSAFDDQLTRALAADTEVRVRVRTPAGRELHVEGTLSDLTDDEAVGGVVLTVRDVTERVRLEQRLDHQAFHDTLTGLCNRRLFTDRLNHALTRRGGHDLVVLFLDLDDFKTVNDDLGHGAGDAVLVEVGQRVTGVTRPGDTVARLGGDEFAILMEATTVPEAELVAQRLQVSLYEELHVEGARRRVGASIGLATATPGSGSGEEALRHADVAMYLAKSRGKSGIAAYEPQLHTEAIERLHLRTELEAAIGADELVLHFQPVVELRSNVMTGYEALVRWQHPAHGLLQPISFVPLAEQSGLIVALGRWVMRAACNAAVRLHPGVSGPSMSVNVAAQQLAEDDFVEQVVGALEASGLAPGRLVLEITESVVLNDLDLVLERLRALRELGIRVAIDDFGTGYSSLAYLSRLPLDILKVDKSFIDHVVEDEQDARVTMAIIAMSATMNLSVVAEGVETEPQAQWLRDAGCRSVQGYLFSRPVPEATALALLEGREQLGGSASGSWGPLADVPAPRTAVTH